MYVAKARSAWRSIVKDNSRWKVLLKFVKMRERIVLVLTYCKERIFNWRECLSERCFQYV